MVNVKMSVKRIKCAKKDCQKYLKSINHSIIACDETISVMNNLSTNLNKCRQGEAVVSQMWTSAWKKDYSNHIFVTFTEIN